MSLHVGCSDNRIFDNAFTSNSGEGMNASENGGILVDARFNSWGDPSGPYHPSQNPNGFGDNVTDLILFDPWTEKGENAPRAELRGMITDQDGTPIIGATISVNGGNMNISVMTRLDWYLIENIPILDITWTLRASKEGYETTNITLTIMENMTVDVILIQIVEGDEPGKEENEGDEDDEHRLILPTLLLLTAALSVALWLVVTGRIQRGAIGEHWLAAFRSQDGVSELAGNKHGKSGILSALHPADDTRWDDSDMRNVTEHSHRCLDCNGIFEMDALHRPIRPACPKCNGFRIQKVLPPDPK